MNSTAERCPGSSPGWSPGSARPLLPAWLLVVFVLSGGLSTQAARAGDVVTGPDSRTSTEGAEEPVTGPCGRPSAEVAGTHWRLEPGAWTPAECATLETLAERLPTSWRMTKRPVRVSRATAPALPDDLSTPHTIAVADPRRHTITLAIEGLGTRIETWADAESGRSQVDRAALARDLLQRQWVHAVAHLVDHQERLSRRDGWLRLGWSRAMRRYVAAERHPAAFVNAHGRVSPLEDLATVAEAYFVPEAFPTSITDLAPRCRMPSKWRYMAENAGLEPATAPACAALEAVGMDPARVQDIELVYVGSTLASAASIGGHVLVALKLRPDALGVAPHDAYGLVAETGDLQGGPAYAWMGLTGGFLSYIVWEPFEATLLRYSELEDRDVMRYRLRLDAAQKERVLARLDELRQAWDRPYYFLQRNCSQLPAELLRAALSESFQAPSWVSPDVIMALAAQRGLLEPIPVERPQELALGSRALAATKLRAEAADRLIALNPGLQPRLKETLAAVARAEVEPRVSAYADLGRLAAELDPPADSLAALSRFLSWSDPIEHARHLEARRYGRTEPEPAIDAIRGAQVAVRRRALESGITLPDPRETQQALVTALERDRRPFSPHTSYRPWSVLPTVIRSGADTAAFLTLGGALYTFHRGDARQFGLSEGMELELMVTEAQLGISPASHRRLRWKAGEVSYIPSSLARVRAGWYGSMLDVTLVSEGEVSDAPAGTTPEATGSGGTSLRSSWAEGGMVVSLWETGYFQHAVGLRAGMALRSDLVLTGIEPSVAPIALAAPLGVEARFGSATQPLTALQTRWTWSPSMTSRLEPRQEAAGTARLRARVGSVSGVDVAVGAEYHGRWEGSLPGGLAGIEQQLRAGLWLERF